MIKMEAMLPYILEAFSKNLTFIFPIHGTSMQPLLHTGDTVRITPVKEIKKGDILLYKRENGQFVLHRVFKIKDTLTMIGDHQVILEKGVKKEWVIAKVISYKKKGKEKEYLMNNFKYKFYKFMIKFRIIHRIFLLLHL